MVPLQAFSGDSTVDDHTFTVMDLQGRQQSRPDFRFQQHHQFRPDTPDGVSHNCGLVKWKIMNHRAVLIPVAGQLRQALIENINSLARRGSQQNLDSLIQPEMF